MNETTTTPTTPGKRLPRYEGASRRRAEDFQAPIPPRLLNAMAHTRNSDRPARTRPSSQSFSATPRTTSSPLRLPFAAAALKAAERDAEASVERVRELLEAVAAALEEADRLAGESGWLAGLTRTGLAHPFAPGRERALCRSPARRS